MNPFCLPNDSNHNTQTTPQPTHGIVFIDSRIENYKMLRAGVSPRLQVFILDPGQDGVVQISHILSDWIGLSCLYIVSHGTPGCLQLGAVQLNLETLDGYRRLLKNWVNALSEDADILLCNSQVAKGERGKVFVQTLSQIVETNILTSAEVTLGQQ
jgi:hypothetical protein